MEQREKVFVYDYSAKRQKELEAIVRKYDQKEVKDDKLEQLKKLDKRVTQKGTMTATTMGGVGVLLLGFGMTCCLHWKDSMFTTGVIVGIVGLFMTVLAYPVWSYLTKREMKKVTPKILELAREIRQEQNMEK